ncbi:sortase [bacterium]|nr:sortase [bacterium]
MAFGFLILGTQVAMPLIIFKTQDQISKPVSSSVLGITSGFREFEFDELGGNYPIQESKTLTHQYFNITIPKLNIADAAVETNSSNLNPIDSLGHYKGSALPGDVGNAFIYGHSVLPWFFNPKNYKTIFSTLNNLEIGDEIFVEHENQRLVYKVESKDLLSPNDVEPLAEIKPKYLNDSTMVLMTCWPPGTKTKRLLINTVLTNR